MNPFLIGLAGAFVGGILLAGAVSSLFWYEKKQANKKANEVIDDLKKIYINKLNNLGDVSKVTDISKVKMN